MSTELPDKAPSYARPYRDPRSTGYGYPAEDPKYAYDGPDEPNWPESRWAEWRVQQAAADRALDRGIASRLAAMSEQDRAAVLAGVSEEYRRVLDDALAELERSDVA